MRSASPGSVFLCAIVRGELVYGAYRSRDPQKVMQEVDRFCAGLLSLPYDDRAADHCGQLRAQLAAAGTPIGPNDLMIASIALANGLTVVSNNVSEFSRVPGLAVEDWSQP